MTAQQYSMGMLFETAEMRDTGTLDVEVLQDWHVDSSGGKTRQKLIEITVAQWWPGQVYRVPVRLIVPLSGKATGFSITGNHAPDDLTPDAALDSLDTRLIEGGVGVVFTVVQALPTLPEGQEMERQMFARLLQSHDPRYTAFWIWPMTLMRAATAAHLEADYIEPGRIAASGGSKNGVAAATALINDERFTAAYATFAPAYASPFRLGERAAVDMVDAATKRFRDALARGDIDPGTHPPEWYADCAGYGAQTALQERTLAAGWTREDFHRLLTQLFDHMLVSRNWERLKARSVDVFFEPGTHDWVAYDILWGAEHHPEIAVYHRANDGHDQTSHPAAETTVGNREALFLKHFFGGSERLLEPAATRWEITGGQLAVRVEFCSGPVPESGRIWWMYDRDPGGSAGFLWKLIPDDQWQDMTFDAVTGTWTAVIALDSAASSIEFFSNHALSVNGCQTYLSSPYTRVRLGDRLQGWGG